MSIADEIRALGHYRGGSPCGVAKILAAMPAKQAAEMRTALDNRDLQHAAIANWLTKHGHRIHQITVMRHRNGQCGCGK